MERAAAALQAGFDLSAGPGRSWVALVRLLVVQTLEEAGYSALLA